MAIFRYEAADVNGKVLRGAMDAPTAQEVTRRLSERGYRSVQVLASSGTAQAQAQMQAVSADMSAPRPGGLTFGKAVRAEDLGVFFRQLGSLVNAGFTVGAALADLGPRTSHRGLRTAATQMAATTASGASLSGEMAKYPGLFPAHVVGLVHAGETGGFLPFAFEEAALSAEQDTALRQGLWLARFLIWQSIWSVLLFQPLIGSINPENVLGGLAGYGRKLLFIAIPVGIGLHLFCALAGWLWRQPMADRLRGRLSLAIPVMARVARMRAMASFTRVLRRLLMAGISPEPAFVGAARSVPNLVLSERLLAGASIVRAGQGIDAAIQATGMMEHDPLQLLVTGQKTGQWIEMLDRVTAYYQEEAARATDAAKSAQKRVGVIVTLVSTGYIMCAATYYLSRIGFEWTESWTEQ